MPHLLRTSTAVRSPDDVASKVFSSFVYYIDISSELGPAMWRTCGVFSRNIGDLPIQMATKSVACRIHATHIPNGKMSY